MRTVLSSPLCPPAALLLAVATLAPAVAVAADVPTPVNGAPVTAMTDAHLKLTAPAAMTGTPARRREWRQACNVLGKAFSAPEAAPWGLAAFSRYRCDAKVDKTFGQGAGVSLWTLDIEAVGDEGELRLRLRPTGAFGKSAVATVLTLGEALEPMDLLADPELARRIAATLIDGQPMLARVSAPVDGGSSLTLRYPAQTGSDQDDAVLVPPPPKQVHAYKLNWDAAVGLWRPTIVGGGRLDKVVTPRAQAGGDGAATYEWDAAVVKALAEGPLWLHNARGAGSGHPAWSQATKSLHAELADAQEARLSAPLVAATSDLFGYVGLRYGAQILTGNKLLEETRFFGLLLEVRAGPLSGLQYYYDVLPETSYAETSLLDQAVDSQIAWARHVLGYTFRIPFPWLIDRITLTPKLGIWTLNAKIPGGADAEGRVDELRQFSINEAFSGGVELGAEILTSYLALRPWAGVDLGYSPLGDDKRVTSRRVGTDLYVVGPRFGSSSARVRMAFLGFAFIENVALTSGVEEATEEAPVDPDGVRRTVARRIEYNAGYAGLGLALSW